MVKVDLDDRRIEAGVRDLIASGDALRPRTAGMSSLRAVLGNEVHARYRDRREDEHGDAFMAERVIKLELEVDGFGVTLNGRIDGLLELPTHDGSLVEEVKSVIEHGSVDLTSARLQVCTYALALLREGEARPPTTRIVLITIADDDERHVPVPFDPEATEAKLAELVRGTIVAAERARRLTVARAHWAESLAFPHEELRAGQAELVEAIEDALVEARPLVVEAPTGTGKTAAALFGALRFAASRGARVYYATPKTTQQQHVAETFEALCRASADGHAEGIPPPFAVGLHARGRLCTVGGRRCERRTCPRLERYPERAPATLTALALEHRHVSLEVLTAAGARDNLCPYELAFDLAADADLVIGDFNYVYDPGIAILSGAKRESIVVIDEAHNLLDRARAYASAELTRADVERAQRALSPVDPLALPMTAFVADLDQAIESAFAYSSGSDEGMLSHDGHLELPALPPAFDGLAARARVLLLRWLARTAPDSADPLETRDVLDDADPVAELLRTAIRLGSAGHEREAGSSTERLVPYAIEPKARGGPGVGIVCVDPAPALTRRHREARGTIAMSGTFAPLDYWNDVLGLQSLDAIPLRVPSPFSPDQRKVVIVPTISTSYRDRRRSLDAVAGLVADTVALREGPYLVFFPSFAYLTAVRPRLPPVGELLVQTPRSSLAERRALLDRFRRVRGTRLLLAVSGGVFGEGIDLPGDELLGAIVVGPCLPPVSFERAAMARTYEATRQAGFAYAMLYPGMQRVVQAAGRVIRREDDHGVVVLIGRRFVRQEILECLPDDWYHYDPSELVPEDPIAALAQFWDIIP